VGAAHAVYKEHIVLLMDYLVAWSWMNKRTWSIAVDQGVKEALGELLKTCSLVKLGVIETPYRLKLHIVLKAYLDKIVRNTSFRATLLNILKYITTRKDLGKKIITRIIQRSY